MDVDSPATTTVVNHGFALIQQAEQLEKLGNEHKALESYKKGIDLLNILLSSWYSPLFGPSFFFSFFSLLT
jgi:hypothetical protein